VNRLQEEFENFKVNISHLVSFVQRYNISVISLLLSNYLIGQLKPDDARDVWHVVSEWGVYSLRGLCQGKFLVHTMQANRGKVPLILNPKHHDNRRTLFSGYRWAGTVTCTELWRFRGNVSRSVAYPGILFRGGGSTNSVKDRVQRERGSGGGSPLVRSCGGSCNLVQ